MLHLIAGELYKIGAPSNLYSLCRALATVQSASPKAFIVESSLYRKINIDFAGAEIVGITRLLRFHFEEKLGVRKYVRQLTIMFGPLVIKQGTTIVARYLGYILRQVEMLPNLQTFR